MSQQKHWENVYATKTPNEVSWTQEIPKTSLEFIRSIENYRSKSIIDVGAGDSNLVDFLLDDGCKNITVLDISGQAIERAKKRLGQKADKVKWVVSDILDFEPSENFDIWHDRAAFHFLTDKNDISKYASLVNRHVVANLIIGTFSTDGPKKCSGLEITQYDEPKMKSAFLGFEAISCRTENHQTPFGTTQNFLFCSFGKRVFSITSERLQIRNMKTSDLEDFIVYRSNPEIVKYQGFGIMDREKAQNFIEQQTSKNFGNAGEWVQYAIENRETGRLIGDCAIKLDAFDTRVAEIGITVSHLHQKNGYARETLNAIVDFLFSLPDFHRIVELVDTRNEASIKMLEACGFHREGHFVQSYFDDGNWTDEYQYAMTRADRRKP
ncbi:GNAT family N-acetyltransferase [Flavobacterium sp. MAH-1]|uniref:GNAT family N-acetyltransferase n=1 Tax=Flavobacterium agri TaxID=2743471 RepID=A0A7Y9C7C3_9FLAO|nr:GNAT family N-acetyltransferase [Flavobacterium agri]NUY81198.1 GNAT family N-acetyltransferase [Flavobacterium agri]NYA71222.1 GNAT family N-acetyltransferase [Flavobacterium agri]